MLIFPNTVAEQSIITLQRFLAAAIVTIIALKIIQTEWTTILPITTSVATSQTTQEALRGISTHLLATAARIILAQRSMMAITTILGITVAISQLPLTLSRSTITAACLMVSTPILTLVTTVETATSKRAAVIQAVIATTHAAAGTTTATARGKTTDGTLSPKETKAVAECILMNSVRSQDITMTIRTTTRAAVTTAAAMKKTSSQDFTTMMIRRALPSMKHCRRTNLFSNDTSATRQDRELLDPSPA